MDRSKCMGTMTCVHAAKGVFYLKDGKAAAKDENVENLDNVIEATEMCPVSALSIIDEETGELLQP